MAAGGAFDYLPEIAQVEEEVNDAQRRRARLVSSARQRREKQAFYAHIAPRISPQVYGDDSQWDLVLTSPFPVYVDIHGFGLCVTTRGRWNIRQGRQVVCWGVRRVEPFEGDSTSHTPTYYEVPTSGSVGQVPRTWVLAMPIALILFRWDRRNNAASQLELAYAKDAVQPSSTGNKVMRLDNFLASMRADTDNCRGYKMLWEAMHLHFPQEVERYMTLNEQIRGEGTVHRGPAEVRRSEHLRHKNRAHHRRSQPQTIVVQAPSSASYSDSDTDSDTEGLIGFGLGVDNAGTFDQLSNMPASDRYVSGTSTMDAVKQARLNAFMDRDSTAITFYNFRCGLQLPSVPHRRRNRQQLREMRTSEAQRLSPMNGGGGQGTWKFSAFDI